MSVQRWHPLIRFIKCPECNSLISFEIKKQVLEEFKKNRDDGIVSIISERRITPLLIEMNYFIINNRIEMMIKEEKKDHFIYILFDSHLEIREMFPVDENKVIAFFEAKLKTRIDRENLAQLLGAIWWDEFYQIVTA